jgi:ESCRT-I complex subunit VPS28
MSKTPPPRRSVERVASDRTPIELYSSSKERQHYDDLANLFSIITATEHLERAYARDSITQTEYTTECNKLISQFRLAEKAALQGTTVE